MIKFYSKKKKKCLSTLGCETFLQFVFSFSIFNDYQLACSRWGLAARNQRAVNHVQEGLNPVDHGIESDREIDHGNRNPLHLRNRPKTTIVLLLLMRRQLST